MRKAIMIMLSIIVAVTVAVVVTGQADAKGNKTTTKPFVFTKHYDKSSPRQQTGSAPQRATSGSSQMKGSRR